VTKVSIGAIFPIWFPTCSGGSITLLINDCAQFYENNMAVRLQNPEGIIGRAIGCAIGGTSLTWVTLDLQ
jgi:hypothetical protein